MRISDWSSDVCSSDLPTAASCSTPSGLKRESAKFFAPVMLSGTPVFGRKFRRGNLSWPASFAGRHRDRKSVVSGKRVSVRVDLGGRRIIKKKKQNKHEIL